MIGASGAGLGGRESPVVIGEARSAMMRMARNLATRTCGGAFIVLLAALPGFAQQNQRTKAAEKAVAKGPVQVEIHILTELSIAELTIETDPFSAWARPVIETIERLLSDERAHREVVIQVVLHPKGPPDVSVAGRPAPSKEEVQALSAAVSTARAPNAKLVDFAFRFVVKINGGHPARDLALHPPLATPYEQRLERFEKATTADQLSLLRRWSVEEVLPVLAAFANRVDPKYKGVRTLGQMVGGLDTSRPIDVEKLTERNSDYWRALLEMTPGEPLVPLVRIALHVANGEIDKARRFAEVASVFDAGKAGTSRLLAECRTMIGIFERSAARRINHGIKLHDEGKLAEAIQMYDSVLKDYPRCAWANYERFQTRRARAMKGEQAMTGPDSTWAQAAKTIYGCDPLYTSSGEATSGPELYRVLRRKQIEELFKTKGNTARDLVEYADIALDLDADGFAAFLYWQAAASMDPQSYKPRRFEDLIESFLYALDRLGIADIKENFRGDHKAAFARIAADRRKLMEQSPAFKAFKPAEPAKKR
jgi:tetratricopeptide (TPR) repeat protein